MTDTPSSSLATLFYQHATTRGSAEQQFRRSGAPTRRQYDEARTYNLYCEVCECVTEHTLAIAGGWEYYTCTHCPTTLAYKVR
jgi:hypothetical protein